MVEVTYCINVYSELNEWIDFCIILMNSDYRDYLEANQIVEKAYDEWMENESCDPIAGYICDRLTENNYEFDIYFNEISD